MNESISSDGLRLSAHLARPLSASRLVGGVVLCHGFPSGPRGAASSAATYPELADRIARDAGWVALAFNFRGTGASEGDFSVGGWLADLGSAVGTLAGEGVSGVWVIGVAEGGTLAIRAAAADERIRGVAVLGAPVALERRRAGVSLVEYARRAGMIRSSGFPADVAAWESEAAAIDAVAAARRLAPRPLLVVHGTDDEVSASAARAICDAAGPTAELRLVHAAGRRLRHDPRAMALLLGWLGRQQP